MYKILVPTDFSACATFAEDLALSIAKKVEGEVHFYHRAAIPHNWKDITENDKNRFPEIWDEVRSTELNLQRCMVKAKEKQVNSKRVYSHGKLIENVIDYVDTFDIDLIVMGSHGASGINEWLIGSNTQKVVRLAHCPVLTIKKAVNPMQFKHIAFASNFDANLLQAFEKVLNFAQMFGANVHLLNVDIPTVFKTEAYKVSKNMEIFKKLCDKKNINYTTHIFYDNDYTDGIKHYTKNNNIDLVAMATHGRNYLSRVFMGSMSEKMVNHLNIPLLTVNYMAVL